MAGEARVLLLGGTAEAAELAERLAGRDDLRLTTTLAGVTTAPRRLPGEVVVGGFGGAARLKRHLVAEGVAALVDATHPFAVRMARNADRAALAAGVPRLKLWRPAWEPAPGDRWLEAADVAAASRLAAEHGRRPLVSLGGRGLGGFDFAPFARALVRAIEAPPELPANAEWVEARGPFAVADERRLLTERGIDVVVTKNAGGEGARAKLTAARDLGLPVVLIRRPPPPAGPLAASVDAALGWLDQVLASRQT
ncbi:MAG: cobalt-precorrin-6A reductase [Alphaproteobacteria bacterium]|jgi:precorrin-6A/cobalt-precorrin-6A reductase|nr:cobalt-precorrin-6A reductase [Alphaproteobacteria bacterium]